MKTNNKDKHKQAGFTLIEVLMVVVIIGILVGVALPRLSGRRREAEIAATRANIQNLSMALSLYELDHGEYPSSLQGLISGTGSRWKGPYLKQGKLPKDAWGNGFTYSAPGSHNQHSFDLSSPGPGSGSNVSINNWDTTQK